MFIYLPKSSKYKSNKYNMYNTFDRDIRDRSGLWQKKHLKKSILPRKKSTFLAKKAPI